MSILSNDPSRRQETTMAPAVRRTKRFTTLSLVAMLALFGVLAVKAQVAPARHHWMDFWPGYEQQR